MKSLIFIVVFKTIAVVSLGQAAPTMRMDDKIRIKEAFNIAKKIGPSIWEGIDQAPFALILVEDSIEFLVNHPAPPEGFLFSENDVVLGSPVYYRKRQFPVYFLTTFPVNGTGCIVVGTPENTKKNSTDWITTLLHEHFHQYVNASPGYFASVDSLDLSGGDQTGMWMLNYPFPYEDKNVQEKYSNYVTALIEITDSNHTKGLKKKLKKYIEHRNEFRKALGVKDYNYFSFQLWQEGIARYTEYKFLETLSTYSPSDEVKQLHDFISFSSYKETFIKSQLYELKNLQLKRDKRVCFYAIGFAEGVLLDRLNPGWRNNYLKDRFYVENYRKSN